MQAAAAGLGGAGSLPSGMKARTPKLFDGQVKDLTALESFLYSCNLYFHLTGLGDDVQQAVMAILWLTGEAAIWWQTVRATHEVGLTWPIYSNCCGQSSCPWMQQGVPVMYGGHLLRVEAQYVPVLMLLSGLCYMSVTLHLRKCWIASWQVWLLTCATRSWWRIHRTLNVQP